MKTQFIKPVALSIRAVDQRLKRYQALAIAQAKLFASNLAVNKPLSR